MVGPSTLEAVYRSLRGFREVVEKPRGRRPAVSLLLDILYTSTPKYMPYCEKKVIVSGNVVEIYTFEEGFYYNEPDFFIEPSEKKQEKVFKKEVDISSIYRTKRNLRRLIEANSGAYSDGGRVLAERFVTLTFKENVRDLTVANREWNRFLDRFNRKFYERGYLKYVGVPEFQKRGAVHYHALFFNMPFLKDAHKKLWDSWGHGFVFREDVKKGSLTRYLSKYIEKGFRDPRLKNRRRYLASRGLFRSKQVRDKEHVDFFVDGLEPKDRVYEKLFMASFPIGKRVFYERFVVPVGKMPLVPEEAEVVPREIREGWYSVESPFHLPATGDVDMVNEDALGEQGKIVV